MNGYENNLLISYKISKITKGSSNGIGASVRASSVELYEEELVGQYYTIGQ